MIRRPPGSGRPGSLKTSERDEAPVRSLESSGGTRRTFLGRLFAPVDIASLVYFRVVFGAIMFWEVCRYFLYGWARLDYVEPTFHFTYYGFHWVQPWSGEWMYLHFFGLGVLAIMISLGALYRLSMTLFFLGFTQVFLTDQALYLNHFYLISLISLLLIFIPAHRTFSVDAWLRPNIRSNTVPAWALWLLAAQVGIAYFYGGLAKLNGDWLRGEPMRMWLGGSTDFPVVGRFFTEEWAVYLFSYGGLLFDLLILPFLLWRRTRLLAFFAAVTFHVMNANLFQIGIFPWFMIAATLLFFPPSWPRMLLSRLRRNNTPRQSAHATTNPPQPGGYVILALLGLYFAVQLLVPLRHHLYPGNVSWTEEGHRFSWHMKLRDKQAEGRFVAVDPASGDAEVIRPWEYGLTVEQEYAMFNEPDMVLQFAHHVAEELREQGREDVEVRALAAVSLNGRDPQLLIDPSVDLAEQRRTLTPADWVLPLEEPLAAGERRDPDRVFGPRQAEYHSELRRAAEEAGWNDLFQQGDRGPESRGASAGEV